MTDLQTRLAGLLSGVHRLGVAFSGAVDSSLLLALTARVLGREQVVALLGVSPSLAAPERAAAHAVVRDLGVAVVEVLTRELGRPQYRANGPDRRFHCKDELFTSIDGPVARIELPQHDLIRVVGAPLRNAVHGAVRDAGFRLAAVDLTGIRSGAFTLPLVVAHA
jgi:PP-loop superfamily ATP-utilizing enzyme